MPPPDPRSRERDRIHAEAAAWLARLHADDRSRSDVEGFNRWLAQGDLHGEAFDTVTASWDLVGGLHDIPREQVAPPTRRAVLAAAGAGAGIVAAGGAAWLALRPAARAVDYASAVGEVRRVTLGDGSRLVLDTASRAEVAIAADSRRLTLLAGRAHVEVAKDPRRPFSVTAADRQVVARGTMFEVELVAGGMAVLLTEGLVDVVGDGGERNALVPGQRLRSIGGVVRIDQPDVGRVSAWQSGRLIFDGDTLADAVEAMNRYDRRKIVLPEPSVGALRIGGSYATGDTRLFARSVAQLLGIRVDERADAIVLRSGGDRADVTG